MYVAGKDFASAEAQLRKIVESDPDDVRARAELGDLLAAGGNMDGAGEVYQAMIDRFPEDPLGYLRMSRLYAQKKDDAGALAVLEKGFQRNPGSKPLLTTLVQAFIGQERFDEGAAACEAFLAASGEDALAYNLLGYVDIARKNYPDAERMLKRAIALQPMNPAIHNNLAKLYLIQGKKQEAIDNLEATLAQHPDSGAAYLTLALIHERDKAYQKAIDVYQRALDHNPEFWFATNNMAFLISETSKDPKDLEKAADMANQALAARPDDPSALDTLGWIYYRMGEYDKALGPIEQALTHAPDDRTIQVHLGMVLYKLDRVGEAREKLEKALAGDGDFVGREEAEGVFREKI